MLSEAQLIERKSGIGASDVASVFGLSPYKSRYQLWEEKTSSEIEIIDAAHLRYGNYMEPFIINEYISVNAVGQCFPENDRFKNRLYRHEKYEFLICHIDALIEEEEPQEDGDYRHFLLEIKTARNISDKAGWGRQNTDEMPLNYLLQCAHELLVYNSSSVHNKAFKVDLAAWSDGQLFIYTYYRNEALENKIIEECDKFWDLVKHNVPPEALTYEEATRKFKYSEYTTASIATDEIINHVSDIKHIKEQKKILNEKEDLLKAKICECIGESNKLVSQDNSILATWNQATANRFDNDRFKREHPDLYSKYIKSSTYRTLLIK